MAYKRGEYVLITLPPDLSSLTLGNYNNKIALVCDANHSYIHLIVDGKVSIWDSHSEWLSLYKPSDLEKAFYGLTSED